MTKNESVTSKITIAVVLLGISYLVLVSVPSGAVATRVEMKSGQSQKELVLGNNTRSLAITKAEIIPSGRLVHIAVKNTSDKNIDWFRLSLGAGSDVEADFSFADKSSLEPGEVYEDDYPFDSTSNELRITIVSLLFEDKASEGDLHFARLLKTKRAGQARELSRLAPFLRNASETSGMESDPSLLQNLETQVSSTASESNLPDSLSSIQTEAWLIGVRTARNRVLSDIQRIKTVGGQDRNKELTKLEGRYNSITSKLAAYNF